MANKKTGLEQARSLVTEAREANPDVTSDELYAVLAKAGLGVFFSLLVGNDDYPEITFSGEKTAFEAWLEKQIPKSKEESEE